MNTEHILGSLFHQDPTTPAIYAGTFGGKSALEPEKMLMLAVLEDAVYCMHKHLRATSRKGQRLMRETEDWLHEEDGEWLFSFTSICDALGLDANYVRQGLMRWKQNLLRQSAAAGPAQRPKRPRKSYKGVKVGMAA
jgi:hypothetical protein